MNGQLSEHPLGELISELCEKKQSGCLRLEQTHGKVAIYFEVGNIVYAASNVRSLRLAEELKNRQLVTDSQLEGFDKRSDLSLASALCQAKIVDFATIQSVLGNLVSEVLQMALLWTEGKWNFEIATRLNESFRVAVNVINLMMERARQARLPLPPGTFQNRDEVISQGASYDNYNGLSPTEGFLLSRVEGEIKVGELITVCGLPEAEALRTIYALSLAGYLKRKDRQSAFELRTEPQREIIAEPVPAPPAPVNEPSPEEDLKDFLVRIEAASNYYEVLSVNPNTPAADVKQAYYGVARKYHPDRFRGIQDSALHTRLESNFARITQAYETLMNPGSRNSYDAKLAALKSRERQTPSAPATTASRPEQPAGTAGERAERSFNDGMAALRQGQFNTAVSLLASAARAVPGDSRYRAFYGKALAANAKTRHAAEAELQEAVRLAPSIAEYRVMLAQLYRDLGFGRRAQAEAKRALTLEPGNLEAKELLKQLM